jgi:uncharacterized membrane protein
MLPQHISSYLALVEVGLISLGPTFAVAKWAELAKLKTKVVLVSGTLLADFIFLN